MPFSDAALVLEWHVIGMFAPGFFTGHLIKRFGVLNIMGVGVLLNAACIMIALSGQDLHQFLIGLFLLGVGWNFLFTGSTTLAMQAYRPEEKDKAQAAIRAHAEFARQGGKNMLMPTPKAKAFEPPRGGKGRKPFGAAKRRP